MIKVKILSSNNFFNHEISIIKKMADSDLEKIAKETEKRLQFNVKTSIQRPGSTGNLAKAFFAERILNGWGIGNIQHLDSTVPYWRWINFGRAKSGRTIPPDSYGHFSPGNPAPVGFNSRSGRWQYAQPSGDRFYVISPITPITPHNFIARTLQQQNSIINSVLHRRRKI